MDLDSVSVRQQAKKRTWPISSHLDLTRDEVILQAQRPLHKRPKDYLIILLTAYPHYLNLDQVTLVWMVSKLSSDLDSFVRNMIIR